MGKRRGRRAGLGWRGAGEQVTVRKDTFRWRRREVMKEKEARFHFLRLQHIYIYIYNGCNMKAEFKRKVLMEIKKELAIVIKKRSDGA